MDASWRTFLTERGATLGEHAGVPACGAFPETDAATTLADLSHQGVLAVRGPDAVKFLQGYITCDVEQLHAGPQEGALCNLQGRMTANFLALQHDDGVLLRMHRSLIEPTRATLAKYIVFSKAKLSDESDRWQRVGIAGADAARLANECTAAGDGTEPGAAPVIVLTLAAAARYEVWLPPAAATDAWDALARRAPPTSVWHWEGIDVAAGRAWVTAITAGEYLPQMFNLDARGAISFTKGCYLGQEIVTRAQHRGGVKRRLARGLLDAPGAAIGAAVRQGAQDVGQVVAVGFTPAREALAVLSLAALRAASAGAPLQVGDVSFALLNLPYPVDN